jgi:hypothetical protein
MVDVLGDQINCNAFSAVDPGTAAAGEPKAMAGFCHRPDQRASKLICEVAVACDLQWIARGSQGSMLMPVPHTFASPIQAILDTYKLSIRV